MARKKEDGEPRYIKGEDVVPAVVEISVPRSTIAIPLVVAVLIIVDESGPERQVRDAVITVPDTDAILYHVSEGNTETAVDHFVEIVKNSVPEMRDHILGMIEMERMKRSGRAPS
jgi:hypothetical protein